MSIGTTVLPQLYNSLTYFLSLLYPALSLPIMLFMVRFMMTSIYVCLVVFASRFYAPITGSRCSIGLLSVCTLGHLPNIKDISSYHQRVEFMFLKTLCSMRLNFLIPPFFPQPFLPVTPHMSPLSSLLQFLLLHLRNPLRTAMVLPQAHLLP